MPYIDSKARERIPPSCLPAASNAGELNYLFTQLAITYFYDHGGRYQQINDILGALEGAKLEFYRRVVAPYEDKKIQENGDVYD